MALIMMTMYWNMTPCGLVELLNSEGENERWCKSTTSHDVTTYCLGGGVKSCESCSSCKQHVEVQFPPHRENSRSPLQTPTTCTEDGNTQMKSACAEQNAVQ